MQTIAIEGTLRTDLGKKATKQIRNTDSVPCVIYGGKENIHFSAPTKSFRHLVYSPDFKVVEITLNGTTTRAIMKDLQFHPVTDALIHLDFVELVAGKSVKIGLPLKMTGVAAGAKKGGALMQKMRRVKVETTPEAMVDKMEVDITNLDLGHSVRIRDIKPVDGVTVLDQPASPIASMEVPRALRSAEASEEGEAVAEAPAVEA